ncbi:ATP-binding protein [Amycolatopsis minnesotensis]|uniref:DNA binding domain-containing protein n=1 Tax=Amycolatopsis minnesotensis TaxID=337894 RepID=A0ABN2SYG5_9PSEU
MTAKEIDQALVAGAEQVGSLLMAAAEDQWFDRKSSRMAAKDLAPALVAFANAEGGTVVVGLHSGKVQGFAANTAKLNDFRQAPFDYTRPPVRAEFDEVACVNEAGDADVLLVIRIDPSEHVHETQTGDCYLRVGDESRRLTFTQRQELQYDKGQSQYDGQPAKDIDLPDLDGNLLNHYKKAMSASSVQGILQARSLRTRKGEVTNGGYLLFGRTPGDLFPEAYVRVLRFLDTERGTGAGLNVEEGADLRIEGPIPHVVQRASMEIEKLVPKKRALLPDGTFGPTPIVPRDAWLEGLVNAVIHRSYSIAGDHIRVEIYPNRIEIESPGRFPGLASPSKPLDISRFARNPRIARVCADLRIGQELGEGIKRIFAEMRRVGLTDPIYRQTAGTVRLSLVNVPSIDPRLAAQLPSGSQRVLAILRSAGGSLGTGDIVDALQMSRPATMTRLRALQNVGLVRRIGKSQKDPRAVWELVDGS